MHPDYLSSLLYFQVPWGTRYVVELCLCGLFAVDFLSRTLGASSPLRKALQPGSILELVVSAEARVPYCCPYALSALFQCRGCRHLSNR